MKDFPITFVFCFIALFSPVFGGSSEPESPETSFSDQIRKGGNSFKQASTNSLLPLTPKHDTVLVAAPDGTIYLVDINSRKIRWSFTSGPSIYSSYQAFLNQEFDNHNTSRPNDHFFIDCGEDWELYLHGNGFKKVKLPFSVEEFLGRMPYVSGDGGVMLGSKKTTVFLVDAKSGSVLHTYSLNDFPPVGDHSAVAKMILPRKDLAESTPVKAVDQLLYIMRIDYTLEYRSMKTGETLWYLTFSDIDTSFQCKKVDNFSAEVSHGEDNVSPVLESPLNCQRRPVVYRIRDRKSLDSLFVAGKLPNLQPGGKVLSLPAPVINPVLQHVDEVLEPNQNYESKKVVALPHDSQLRIMALPSSEGLDAGITHANIEQSYKGSATLLAVLGFLIMAILCYLCCFVLRKQGKLNMQAEDQKAPVMSKKKKTRNKNFSPMVEQEKNVLHNYMTGSKGNFQSTFADSYDDPTNERKIGKLLVFNKEIAKGSNGTIVLEGNYHGRAVAVKRLVLTHHDVAMQEIRNLITSENHPNIVRYYGVELDQSFVYISLERCTCSLHDLILSYSSSSHQEVSLVQTPTYLNDSNIQLQKMIEINKEFELWKFNGYPSAQLLKLMRDLVRGLAHLHGLGIIHRDLKPQNVLILKDKSLCAKLSDMGISKQLTGDMTSLTNGATGYGSLGWRAPEQILRKRQTHAVDLFSLGCVLFFCITGGKHPFGDRIECDVNIVNNRKDLFLVESIPEALDLIYDLLNPKPELRPNAVEVLCHPLFWNAEKRLSFLRDASDRVELEDREKESQLLKALEKTGAVALGGKWNEKMENAFIIDIGRYRRYKYDSVRDLLRVIRNKLNHYRELSVEIQGILGPVPEGFESYFSRRFPRILIEVYKVLRDYCREEEFLRMYFKGPEA